VEAKLEVARRLLSEGKTATCVAETVGWSRATLYRSEYEFDLGWFSRVVTKDIRHEIPSVQDYLLAN
jgi:AraC-like DNA-binding protein